MDKKEPEQNKKETILEVFSEHPFRSINDVANMLDTPRQYVLEVLRENNVDLRQRRVLKYIDLAEKYKTLAQEYSNKTVEFERYKKQPGMLEELFDLQKVMQDRINDDKLPNLLPERIPMTVTSIIGELGEILEEEQAWKDWKENPEKPDLDNLRMEVADLWHFVINLTLYLGMDARDLYEEFVDKNEVNHERQDNNY